jgi:tRNA (guanine-N7-)-methyltransferase
MGKGKLVKFAQLAALPNVLQNHERHSNALLVNHLGEKIALKGKWNADFFENNQPITLELACGGGEYTVALAAMHPDRNFVGIDIKGARILRGAKQALDAGNTNAAFIRTRIEELLQFFAPNEVSEIWLTFPDPFLRNSDRNHRLTSYRFLRLYQQILAPDALIHLKTDEPNLYHYTLEVLADIGATVHYHDNNIYAKPLILPELGVKTYFESIDIANESTVKYIQFSLPEREITIPKRQKIVEETAKI